MKTFTTFFLLFIGSSIFGSIDKNSITKERILLTIKKSADYMASEVSNHGGFLWTYSEDLSEQDGEAPGRKTQIMVFGGTTTMGNLFLDIYETTNDSQYLKYAQKAADALIYGQLASGGWHYLIDFDIDGIQDWYNNVASKFKTGMEEYRYYYGNCTFDDNTTQGATSFLLRYYMVTLNPAYLPPLKKALDFILEAQYPNGGWPQRYPLRYNYAFNGLPDYSAMYTLNDDAMSETISLLLRAYEKLGDIRYLDAAKHGGDFFIISQGPKDQAAWAEQYDMNLKPCWARTHEPPGYMVRQTIHTMNTLSELFLFTGDNRFLKPIPAAFDWLESSKLRVLENGHSEFARMYEPKTNLPIKCDLLKEEDAQGHQLYNYAPVDKNIFLEIMERKESSEHPILKQYEGKSFRFDLEQMKTEFDYIAKLDKNDRKSVYYKYFDSEHKWHDKADNQKVEKLLNSVSEKGIWIEDVKIWDVHPGKISDTKKAVKGFTINTVYKNIEILLEYLNAN